MKRWYSPLDLEALNLPGMPDSKRGINLMADREGWRDATVAGKRLARRRKGRGGGWEYHVNALPLAAQRALAERERADARWFRRWRFRLPGVAVTIEIARRGEES